MQKVTYDFIYIKYPKEINPWGQMQIGGCQGVENGAMKGQFLNGYRLSSWGHENILELGRGGDCTTL